METVDRVKTAKAVYPALTARRAAGLDPAPLAHAVTAATEGYPFPTNLDLDPNVNGLTPLSQSELVHQALKEGWDTAEASTALDAYATRHRTDDVGQ